MIQWIKILEKMRWTEIRHYLTIGNRTSKYVMSRDIRVKRAPSLLFLRREQYNADRAALRMYGKLLEEKDRVVW